MFLIAVASAIWLVASYTNTVDGRTQVLQVRVDYIEIVTSQFSLVRPVRKVIRKELGTRTYRLSSWRLRLACEKARVFVKGVYPEGITKCYPVVLPRGYGTVERAMTNPAVYVVQVSDGNDRLYKRAKAMQKPLCESGGARWVTAAYRKAMSALQYDLAHAGKDGIVVGTHEIHGYIDGAPGSAMHRMVVAMHGRIEQRVRLLRRMTNECGGDLRAEALYLLEFSGRPRIAIAEAMKRMDDSNALVRNNAWRIFSDFSKYMTRTDWRRVVPNICHIVRDGTFFDRNKGLFALYWFLRETPTGARWISPKCRYVLGEIAATSESPELRPIAEKIVRRIGGIER